MNNQIKELWDEAAKLEPDPSWEGQTKFMEKFAELIVRKCVSVVEGMSPGYDDYRNQIEDAFRRDCVEEIKHKFGVKDELQH